MSRRQQPLSPRLWTGIRRQSRVPVYRQVYERLHSAITSGTLRPGERLPSVRSLASQLATARGTIDVAYELLASQGYIVCRGAAGTRVAPTLTLPLPQRDVSNAQRKSTRGSGASPKSSPQSTAAPTLAAPLPFQMGMPALDAFPRRVWSRIATRLARELPLSAMMYPAPFGYAPLREAIAAYLAVARGIQCSADSIVVTAGYQGALGLITRVLLKSGDDVWVEDPGYPHARDALAAAGANLVGVPVDEHGMDVSAGVSRSPRARLAVVTPSHQAPLGVALGLSRRRALLSWASQADAWIIEDDYDGEFRYDSLPLPALKSLDEHDRVLYAGTFSKVLFPGLRLGYIVLPECLIAEFTRILQILYRNDSTFTSSVLTTFMTEGHFGRHVKRMRQLYAERRGALADALKETFGDRFRIELQAGGMHLLAHLESQPRRDVELMQRARSRGLAVAALSPWSVERDCGQGLLLSFTNIPTEHARREVQRLERALSTN
jgi:GntR family transcriptional regulator / MocR family aminotransferase